MTKNQTDTKSETSKKSGKLHTAIEQAQAIQQRQQLRKMITDKFIKDLAKGNKNISKIIEEKVNEYFSKEKVTEDSLRVLKQNITKTVEDYRNDNKSGKNISMQRQVKNQLLPNNSFKSVMNKTKKATLHLKNLTKASPNRIRIDLSDLEIQQLLQRLGRTYFTQFYCFKVRISSLR